VILNQVIVVEETRTRSDSESSDRGRRLELEVVLNQLIVAEELELEVVLNQISKGGIMTKDNTSVATLESSDTAQRSVSRTGLTSIPNPGPSPRSPSGTSSRSRRRNAKKKEKLLTRGIVAVERVALKAFDVSAASSVQACLLVQSIVQAIQLSFISSISRSREVFCKRLKLSWNKI
jgi:hypothetical protein